MTSMYPHVLHVLDYIARNNVISECVTERVAFTAINLLVSDYVDE